MAPPRAAGLAGRAAAQSAWNGRAVTVIVLPFTIRLCRALPRELDMNYNYLVGEHNYPRDGNSRRERA